MGDYEYPSVWLGDEPDPKTGTLDDFYHLIQQIEKLGCGKEFTKAVVMAGDLRARLRRELRALTSAAPAPTVDEDDDPLVARMNRFAAFVKAENATPAHYVPPTVRVMSDEEVAEMRQRLGGLELNESGLEAAVVAVQAKYPHLGFAPLRIAIRAYLLADRAAPAGAEDEVPELGSDADILRLLDKLEVTRRHVPAALADEFAEVINKYGQAMQRWAARRDTAEREGK